jgi:hypothetical protein
MGSLSRNCWRRIDGIANRGVGLLERETDALPFGARFWKLENQRADALAAKWHPAESPTRRQNEANRKNSAQDKFTLSA